MAYFYNMPSIIGPYCVVHMQSFQKEILYLKQNGFNTELIKISPKAHLVTDYHINEDVKNYKSQSTTSKDIASCYRNKYARVGTQIKDVDYFKSYIWNEVLYGNVLYEGVQG